MNPCRTKNGSPAGYLRGSKRRALLALLILHANEVVRTDRLVDELWGEHPPENAPAALQNHVSRLRKALGGEVVVTKPWATCSAPTRRRSICSASRRSSPRRARSQRTALVTEVARLEALRLSALEQRIDTDLELGSHPDLVAELERLVAHHPLRERMRGQLILALYRAGRQAEALETYRETRRVLIDELGIEPSPELPELERAFLRQDPALVVSPGPTAAAVVVGEQAPPLALASISARSRCGAGWASRRRFA